MDPVVEIISKISGKEPDRLLPETNLCSLGITSSLEILKIQSALERNFNLKMPPIGDTWTIERIAAQVGQVNNTVLGETMLASGEMPDVQSNTSPSRRDISSGLDIGGLFIGVDIQEVSHLPVTSNYRTHDFYQNLFRCEEISYALLKPEPRIHLCGIFCAKEALKKSAPDLIQLRMDEIQVHHHQGRPFIKTDYAAIDSRFNFQVSISHSDSYAVSTVLTIVR